MRLPLHIKDNFGQPALYIQLVVIGRHVRHAPIECLVDTGSPWMVISPKDAITLNIPVSRLPEVTDKYANVNFAGAKFKRRLLRNIEVALTNDKGGIERIKLPSVSVLESTIKPTPEGAKRIPSVLGCEFLMNNKFGLWFDPAQKEAFLEGDL